MLETRHACLEVKAMTDHLQAEPPDLLGNALAVAPELLNCALCVRRADGDILKYPITEVEAYHGFEDRASHAHKGKTPRNAVMFGPHGYWYVYLCYGVHWLLNLVTGEQGYPSAVLIRGIDGFAGPGKLTRALGIDKRFDQQRCDPEVGLWIEALPLGHPIRSLEVVRSGRIGVAYAGDHWAHTPWRFYRKGFSK